MALDQSGEIVGRDDFDRQVAQVMNNLSEILVAAGAGLETVAKIGVFLADRKYLPAWRTQRNNYFSAPFPASTLIIAQRIYSDLLIEAEAIAVLRNGNQS